MRGNEQSFATGRISVPLVLSGEKPNIPEYNFLDSKKSLHLSVSLCLRGWIFYNACKS